MADSWTCLMVEKGPGLLDDKIRAALKMAACDLYRRKEERMPIFHDACDGIITTEGKSYTVGSTSGVLFRAHIDTENGCDYRVNFLLSERDLERGASALREMEERGMVVWRSPSGGFPCEELYRFCDLRTAGVSRTVH